MYGGRCGDTVGLPYGEEHKMAGMEQTPLVPALPFDNTELRNRLGEYEPQHRSIEAELRAAMAERQSTDQVKRSRWQ